MITEGASDVVSAKVLSVGYVVLDVVLHQGGIGQRAGGTAGNVAANLAFFGWDSTVAALHGDDPAGIHLRADLARAGVNGAALFERPDMITPVVVHEVLDAGHRYRFGCPECGRRFPNFRPISPAMAESALRGVEPDVLFVDRVSRASALMARQVRARGGLVVFEPSIGGGDRFRELVELAHVVKYSAEQQDHRDSRLRPASADQLQVMTMGANGLRWRFGAKRWRSVSAFQTEVVDAGGAGDWTTAAFLAAVGWTSPDDMCVEAVEPALKRAQAVAALSCQVLGARGLSTAYSQIELDERVDELMASHQTTATRQRLPRRSRRRAACAACLSAPTSSSRSGR